MAILALTALIGLLVLFTGVFLFARRVDNYGVVDVAWSLSFAALAVYLAVAADGWWVRKALFATIVSVWSLRLGIHLWRRVQSHHPEEDGRYATMREEWRANLGKKMFLFFQMQAVSVVVLGLPFLFATSNGTIGLAPLEIAGFAVWLAAQLGESVADAQLARFKRNPANTRRVCDVGLWRYSRHPNYFFEWLIWIGFFLVGAAAPWGWTGVIAPAVILYLLLKVTGVPPTEEQALRSRGEAYRRYQRTTNAFFPGPVHTATRSPEAP